MSEPRDIADYAPTPTQQGMILQALAAPDSPINVEQFVVRVEGGFDSDAFAAAWRKLIERHEALRSRYSWQVDGSARCVIQDSAELAVQIHDAHAWSAAEVDAFIEDDFHTPIDLSTAPIFRFTCLHLADDEWRLLWCFHHLVMDGRSVVLAINEFFAYYDAFSRGVEAPALDAPQPLRRLFEWHAARDAEADRQFWREYLQGVPNAPMLTSIYGQAPPNGAVAPRSKRAVAYLSRETTARLDALLGDRGIGWSALIEALWAILLWRHTGTTDLTFGVTRSGRQGGLPDAQRVIALLINTTPARASVDPDMSLRDFLRERRQDQRRTHSHQHLGLLGIQRASGTGRGSMDSIVIYDHKTIDAAVAPHKRGYDWQFDLRGHTGYPLALFAYGGDRLMLDLSYDPAHFDAYTANRLVERLVRLAESAGEQGGDAPLTSLDWLAPVDRERLVTQWQPRPTPLPAERSIDEAVAGRARTEPNRIALCCEDRELSYASLDAAIDALVARLARRGVKPRDHVAIFLPRSEYLVIAALAVQRLGAAYVPCDPTHPSSRLARVFDVARPVCVITESSVIAALPDNAPALIDIEAEAESPAGDPAPARARVAADDTAYVIFTSGSSGQPKGVVLTHANVMNFLQSMIERPGIGRDDCLLAVTTLSFDIAVLELFGPLLVGARVVIARDPDIFDGLRLARLIEAHHVNRLQATPSTWRLLRLAEWRAPDGFTAMVGGEAMDAVLARDLLASARGEFALWNMYGPTETTVWSTCERVLDSEDIGIGTPIANTRCHVVDSGGALVAPGVVGELYIGGTGVAAGYLDDPERTAAAFIDWSPGDGVAPERSYRTGDLARWDVDAEGKGRLKCLGRSDDQIKIRGHRIEPGEIETALTAHASVAQAVVRLVGDQAPRLVAYLRLKTDFDEDALRAHVSARLPSVMCPNVYMPMESFPLTANGKVDRRSLPMPDLAVDSASARSYIAPRNDIEKTLAEIWTEVTGVPRPGIDDSFFDIGGDSLSLVVARGRIAQTYGEAPSIAELFQYATIRKLAERLTDATTRVAAVAAQTPVDNAPVTTGDRRIAIVGMAGRFPGAGDTDTFWANLVAGVESITHFDADALRPHEPDIDALFSQPGFVAARGVLDDIEYFDAAFFGITPREAALIDPQQRLWLETAWAALEQAGVDPSRDGANVGVFAGAGYLEPYLLHNILHDRAAIEDQVRIRGVESFTAMVSNDKDYLPTRTAYKFGLTGPALNIQTACSTGLVAVHQACMSLLAGESRLAIAGGVSIGLPQAQGYFAQEGGMASLDGHVRTFDEGACGTVFSSGLGAVVLKRYEDAVADGSEILAVIRGSAINNDGAAKMSFTAPSPAGQAAVVHAAQRAAGVSPDEVGYIEAHGTGTPLGDPIEVEGLAMAWRSGGAQGAPVWLGSVKPNVGHLDSAAGLAGLVKTVHAVREGRLPPTLHYKRPNPRIDFASTAFKVVEQLTPWPSEPERPRIAGVSSFGVGGTNAHVIVAEAPPRAVGHAPVREPQLLVLSARTPTALAARCTALAEWLEQHPDAVLADVAWTLAVGRAAMSHRISIVATTVAEAAQALAGAARRSANQPATEADAPPVAFVFPGQGAQYPGMGRALYETPGVFRDSVDRLAGGLEEPLGLDIRTLITPDATTLETAAQRLNDTATTQPAIFAIELALAYQWRAWGVEPDMLLGHSVGEFAAAVLAGVFGEADACQLIATRARLMAEQAPGAMLAVHAAADGLDAYLDDTVEVSAINAPELCVVSGAHGAIDMLAQRLDDAGIRNTRLATSHAFHSRAMAPAMAPLEAAVAAITRSPARRPVVSTLTGALLADEDMCAPDYWSRQMRQAVRFAPAIETAQRQLEPVFVECGPGGQLTAAIGQQSGTGSPLSAVPSQAGPRDDTPADVALLKALGALWQAGVTPDWAGVFGHEQSPRRRLHLPTYPFERKRYWIDPPQRGSEQAAPLAAADSLPISSNETVMPVPDRVPELRERLRTLFHDLSGIDINQELAERTFAGLGMDSMFLTQAASEISRIFGVTIRFRDLLERLETLDALAAHLDAQMPPPVEPAPAPAVPTQPAAAQPASTQPASVSSASAPAAPSQPAAWPPASQSQAAGTSAGSDTHRIVEQQLALMQQQLALLGAAPSAPPVAQPTHDGRAAAPSHSSDDTGTGIALHGRRQADQSNAYSGRFGPYKPVATGRDASLTAAQRSFIATLTTRLSERTPSSRALAESGPRYMADPRHVVGFHRDWKGLTYQIAMQASEGARLTDIDGNDYIDVTMSLGVAFLGHGHPAVRQAVHAQLDRGFELGPQMPTAPRIAERLCRLTGHERATFTTTGSEAVMAALRCARTVTGRHTVVYFTGDYHGTFDEVLGRAHVTGDQLRTRPGVPGAARHGVDDVIVLDYGTQESLSILREHADRIAAVLVEPVQSRYPDRQPEAFVKEVRRITAQSGTALILDEMITGFRCAPGGINRRWEIGADMCTYGKILGGGMPIGALAGSARWLDAIDGGRWRFDDDSIPETPMTFFAGTHVRHPLAMAAADVVLDWIESDAGASQRALDAATAGFAQRINTAMEARGVPLRIRHFSSWFRFDSPPDQPLAVLLAPWLVAHGVYVRDAAQNCFFSIAHTDKDIATVERAILDGVDAMVQAGALPGGSGTAVNARPGHDAAEPAALAVGESMPLIEAQREIWLAQQVDPDVAAAYNQVCRLRLRGSLDHGAFAAAVEAAAARHEALSLRFSADGERQYRADGARLVELHWIDQRDSAQPQHEADTAIGAMSERILDLSDPDTALAEVAVHRVADDRYDVGVMLHHLVCDGWSSMLFFRDLSALYAAKVEHRAPALPAAVPFSHHVQTLVARDAGPDLAWWRELYATAPPPLSLPTLSARPVPRRAEGSTLRHRLSDAVTERVTAVATERSITRYAVTFAAFAALVMRLTGQRDIVVAMPVAGQVLEGKTELFGHCVQTLPLRLTAADNASFADLLATVRSMISSASAHAGATFGQILREVPGPRDPSRLPLAEIVFNCAPEDGHPVMPELTSKLDEPVKTTTQFDLHFDLEIGDDEWWIDCDYATALFDADMIGAWLADYEAVLAAALDDIDVSLDALPVTAAERDDPGARFNPPALALDPNADLVTALGRAAAAAPTSIAIAHASGDWDYARLAQASDRIAAALAAQGVGAGDRVGLCAARTPAVIAAMLGVLKAGAAYVPMDPNYPAERLRFTAEDSAVVLTLVDEADRVLGDTPTLSLETAMAATGPVPEPGVDGEREAYVIYTSGSTGRPKGVSVRHRNVMAFLAWAKQALADAEIERMLASASICFDFSVFELFVPLSRGKTVVLVDDLLALVNPLATPPTLVSGVPSAFAALLRHVELPASVKTVFVGGEPLRRDLVAKLEAQPGVSRVVECYGPTETTVFATVGDTSADGPPTIGPPIAGWRACIVDAQDRPVAVGETGELLVGGAGVSAGYVGREELTAERFVPDPDGGPGARRYRTGDLCRWRDDGRIEFIGRADTQVKLRGFRIELGEIETALTSHPAVEEAVVGVRSAGEGDDQLVAWWKPAVGHKEIEPTALRRYLRERLPLHMVAQQFVVQNEWPRLANGKIDRNALVDPFEKTRAEAAAPAVDADAMGAITALWAEALGHDIAPGAQDTFIDMGGHSLLAVRAVAAARERHGVEVPVRAMMLDSLAQLAMRLANKNPAQPAEGGADQTQASADSSATPAEPEPQNDDTRNGEGGRRDGLMARLGLSRSS